jgi:hypothetical protein
VLEAIAKLGCEPVAAFHVKLPAKLFEETVGSPQVVVAVLALAVVTFTDGARPMW